VKCLGVKANFLLMPIVVNKREISGRPLIIMRIRIPVMSISIITSQIKIINKISKLLTIMIITAAKNFTLTKAWKQKTIITQLGAFSEIKHDPKITINQAVNPGEGCGIPDIYVEPNSHFWEEFLRLIDKLRLVLGPCQESIKSYLEDFSISLKLLLKFANNTVEKIPVPVHVQMQLKNIVYQVDNGEYGPIYDGWYMRMFYNQSDYQLLKEWKPEIADVNDDPEDASIENTGSILHIGTTGRPRVGAVLVEEGESRRLFVMPSYDARVVTTNYPTVLDDENWKKLLSKNYETGKVELN